MVTCQPAIQTKNRRKKLKKKWTGKEWQEKRLEFIKKHNGKCEWCGSTSRLNVHHPYRNGYGEQVYMDFYLSQCVLLCNKCHTAVHVGKVLCTNQHDDLENHYMWHDADMCGYCFLKAHPEIEENKRLKKEADRLLKKRLSKEAKEKYLKEHPKPKNVLKQRK
jgi:hypothetical protein